MDRDLSEKNRQLIMLKLEKLQALEKAATEKARRPHLHIHKFYQWQRELLESRNKVIVLTAANQVGKSSTMIKKNIEWATNESLWPELWPSAYKEGQRPTQFVYLYPSRDIATTEYYDKWFPLLPPQDDPELGWKPITISKYIWGINFYHRGVTIYFKTYRQGEELLQAGTYWMVTADEELPVNLLPELQARVTATDGYMMFGFTATMGQEYWKQVVEDRTKMTEALVKQVSLFDCMKFEDGSPSRWTEARIKQVIDNCTSQAEVARRVYGRFVRDEGLRYPTFNRSKHVVPFHPVPSDWEYYAGIDYGSGGLKAHPSSIVFLAVNPEKTKIRLARCWRGDDRSTTAQDVVNQYILMASGIEEKIVSAYYDWSAADLGTIATRMGLPFQKANKARNAGVTVINTLLKTETMLFYEPVEGMTVDPAHLETFKLVSELESLDAEMTKQDGYMADDLADALRYACISVPVDWTSIPGGSHSQWGVKESKRGQKVDPRTGEVILQRLENDVMDEIAFWNEVMDE
jgi:hypothetical protein